MTDLATILSGAHASFNAEQAARIDDEKAAFTARLQAAIARHATHIVHPVARDIGPAMLAWVEASGARVGLTIAKDHAELHVSLVAPKPAPAPAVETLADGTQVMHPDIAVGVASAVAVG